MELGCAGMPILFSLSSAYELPTEVAISKILADAEPSSSKGVVRRSCGVPDTGLNPGD